MIDICRKPTALLLCGVLSGGLLLGSCTNVERETGISRQGQLGAGAGAAAGGIIAALASANPAWIAASTILGGVTGGAIGEYLNREDAERHASTQYTALNTLEAGQSRSWQNPETGRSGRTTVHDSFTSEDGTPCKRFTETIYAAERTIEESATACQQADGTWQVVAT